MLSVLATAYGASGLRRSRERDVAAEAFHRGGPGSRDYQGRDKQTHKRLREVPRGFACILRVPERLNAYVP